MGNEGRKAHLVGSGIANLAAAAYLIKDAAFRARTSAFTRRRVYRAELSTLLAFLKRVTSCAASACSRRIAYVCMAR
jgi:hypothetical protein